MRGEKDHVGRHMFLPSASTPRPQTCRSSLPSRVLEDLICLLFPRVGLHGALPPNFVAFLTQHLLRLLRGGSADCPVELAEDVGFDGCSGVGSNLIVWRTKTYHQHSTDTGCVPA
jgi:hypothetical protein